MYSTCLYCNNSLGQNEVIEAFPVGRRLAFDQAHGRLWVVCRKCEKWNLSPLEERWEAIEACERLFRDARKRVSTDNIGLARLDEGLELVRIGQPMRPEFAAWRYGDQFGRRQRRAVMIGVGAGVLGGGVVVLGAATGVLTGGGWGIWQAVSYGMQTARRRRRIAVVTAPSGRKLTVRGAHVERAHLIPAESPADAWGIRLPHVDGEAVLYGEHAQRAMALIMPKVNRGGASKRRVQDAVQRIERLGNPARFLEELAQNAPPPARPVVQYTSWDRDQDWRSWKRRSAPRSRDGQRVGLTRLDLETRLAVEMAVNEERERAALEGELALLELEWKEAEEIAAIADNLALPSEVDQQLEDLRRRRPT